MFNVQGGNRAGKIRTSVEIDKIVRTGIDRSTKEDANVRYKNI